MLWQLTGKKSACVDSCCLAYIPKQRENGMCHKPTMPCCIAGATGDVYGDREARFLSALCHIQSVNRAEIKISEMFFSGKELSK